MNDNDFSGAWFFLFSILIFGAGMFLGANLKLTSNEIITIQMCVEKPQDCKIKYDYYKLVESQK